MTTANSEDTGRAKRVQEAIDHSLDYAAGAIGQGKVADYIPALALADPKHLGMTVMLMDGTSFSSGDAEVKFTLQSVVKVFALVYALRELGQGTVLSTVGVEPTGDSFNSIVKLETRQQHPLNPFINAGAIAVVGLLLENGRSFEDFKKFLEKVLDREITIDETVYQSELETGDLNRSLAYFMKSDNVITGDVDETLKTYFRMCSILCDTRDLARFGTILANDGIDCFTGEVILDAYNAALVKTLMMTCGMYDKSGEFAIKVGMPSKSGVSGSILSLVQTRCGIGVYSPELDDKGNSFAGSKALEYLSWTQDLHAFKSERPKLK